MRHITACFSPGKGSRKRSCSPVKLHRDLLTSFSSERTSSRARQNTGKAGRRADRIAAACLPYLPGIQHFTMSADTSSEYELDIGLVSRYRFTHLSPISFRLNDNAKNEANLVLVLQDFFDHVLSRPQAPDDSVTGALQGHRRQASKGPIVLRHWHPSSAMLFSPRSSTGKVHFELRIFAEFAIAEDLTAMLFDDAEE